MVPTLSLLLLVQPPQYPLQRQHKQQRWGGGAEAAAPTGSAVGTGGTARPAAAGGRKIDVDQSEVLQMLKEMKEKQAKQEIAIRKLAGGPPAVTAMSAATASALPSSGLPPSGGSNYSALRPLSIFSLAFAILATIVAIVYVAPELPVFCKGLQNDYNAMSVTLAAAQKNAADLNVELEASRNAIVAQNEVASALAAATQTASEMQMAKATALEKELERVQKKMESELAVAKETAAAERKAANDIASAEAAATAETSAAVAREAKSAIDSATADAAKAAKALEQEKAEHAATKKKNREKMEEIDSVNAINLRKTKGAESAKAAAEDELSKLKGKFNECSRKITVMKSGRKPPFIDIRENMAVEPGWGSVSIPANCTSANGEITRVLWKQKYPAPKSKKKNSLIKVSGYELWNDGAGPAGSLNATLRLVNNVTRKGTSNYEFKVYCFDDFGKNASRTIEMTVKNVNPPVSTTAESSGCTHDVHPDIDSRRVNPTKINSAVGRGNFHGCCTAKDQKIESSTWTIVKTPAAVTQSMFEYDVTDPPEGTSRWFTDESAVGVTTISGFTVEGDYTLQFTCTDILGKSGTTTHTLEVLPAYSIGIDLGTSTTCVAAFDNNNSPVVVQSYDKRFVDNDPCIPSVVALLQNGTVLVGEAAQAQATLNPENTIYEAKRLMGLAFTDEMDANMSYTVRPVCAASDIDCSSATPSIPCGSAGSQTMKIFRPELAAALLLKRAKMLAEEKLEVEIVDAVITVPAQFNDVQRKATEDAATIAGLNLLRIINEPTAAALYLGSPETLLDEAEVDEIKRSGKPLAFYSIVADVGGGTTDYSMLHTTIKPCDPKTDKDCSCGADHDPSAGALVSSGPPQSTSTLCSNNVHVVKATSGDKHLGGRDFNLRILEHVMQTLSTKYPNVDFTGAHIRQELVQRCEHMKIDLSNAKRVEMPPLMVKNKNGNDEQLTFTMSEENLKRWTHDLLARAVAPVKDLMAKYHEVAPDSITAKDMSSVKYLYLVGGSLSMPIMQQALLDAYDWIKPIKDRNHKALIDGDPRGFGSATIAVSIGAALYASNIKRKNQILMTDVLANDHSVLVGASTLDVLIPSGSALPREQTKLYTTAEDGQTDVHVNLFEGSGLACSAEPIADVTISGIPPGPAGREKINVRVYIPGDGRVEIEAWLCPKTGKCETSGGKGKLAVSSKSGRLSADDVENWRNVSNSIESLNSQHSQQATKDKGGWLGKVKSFGENIFGGSGESDLCGAIPDALELPVNYQTQSRCAQNQLAIVTSVNTLPLTGGQLSVVVTVQGKSEPEESSGAGEQPGNVDYILIVDTSGSMEWGGRLNTAKHALKKLAANLRDDDRVSIVRFGSDAAIVLDLVTVRDSRSTGLLELGIESLTPYGGTNMRDGLEEGFRVAFGSLDAECNAGNNGPCDKCDGKHRTEDCPHYPNEREEHEDAHALYSGPNNPASSCQGGRARLQELLLFSDGEPNSKDGLADLIETKMAGRSTATLHTFGFGDGSAPVLMPDLARIGKGEYQYVPENNLDAIDKAFARFKVGAGSKSANYVDVDVKLEPGVKLSNSLPTATHGTSTNLHFKLPPLQKGQPLHMLLQLDVSAVSKLGGAGGKRQILSTTMNYVSLTDGSNHNATETVYVKHDIDGERSGGHAPLLVEEQLQRSMVVDKLRRAKASSPQAARYVNEAIAALETSCKTLSSTDSNGLRECILKEMKTLKDSISASDWSLKLDASLESHKNGRGGNGDCYISKTQKIALAVYMGNTVV